MKNVLLAALLLTPILSLAANIEPPYLDYAGKVAQYNASLGARTKIDHMLTEKTTVNFLQGISNLAFALGGNSVCQGIVYSSRNLPESIRMGMDTEDGILDNVVSVVLEETEKFTAYTGVIVKPLHYNKGYAQGKASMLEKMNHPYVSATEKFLMCKSNARDISTVNFVIYSGEVVLKYADNGVTYDELYAKSLAVKYCFPDFNFSFDPSGYSKLIKNSFGEYVNPNTHDANRSLHSLPYGLSSKAKSMAKTDFRKLKAKKDALFPIGKKKLCNSIKNDYYELVKTDDLKIELLYVTK